MKLLLFDTSLDGHHTDYLTHLIEYWHNQQIEGELHIVAPGGLAAQVTSEISPASSIRFTELTESEIANIRDASMIGRSFAGWNLYLKYANKIQPDHALLMYFDVFQLGLWLGKKSPCPISGIYFRPNFHQKITANWKERGLILRKKFFLNRALSNPEFATLFCLDKSVVPTIQTISSGTKVLPLSDPVKNYVITSDQAEAQKQRLGIEDSRKVFLLFGYLDDRKGIEPVLDALAMLSQEESKHVTLLLAGPIGEDFRHTVETKIAGMNTEAQIICQFDTLKGAAIQTLFTLSDFVLTLYQRHIGMSSIVVRAALSRKPVISSIWLSGKFGGVSATGNYAGFGIAFCDL